jgi:hypothetical protein
MPKAKEQGAARQAGETARPQRTTVKRVQDSEDRPFTPPGTIVHHAEPDDDAPGDEQLTPKQRRFVEAYVGPAAFNGAKAAEMAGYRSDNRESLTVTASENLRKPNVSRALARRLAATRLDPGRTMQRVAELAFSNIGEVLKRGEDGRWRPDLDKAAEYAALGAIRKFKVTETDADVRYEIEMHDSGPMLGLLAKIHGMVVEKMQAVGEGGETAQAQGDLAAIMGDPELYKLAVAYEERRRQLQDLRAKAPGKERN